MKFMRVGGLSAVNHKKYYKANKDEEYIEGNFWGDLHIPPKKKGIYAFPYPYFEPFLVFWSEQHQKEMKSRGVTKFEFDGNVWSHLKIHNPKHILEERGAWTLTSIEVYEDSLRRDIHRLNKIAHAGKFKEGSWEYDPTGPWQTDPYKRGQNGFYSRDSLEVFIDKRSIARIR